MGEVYRARDTRLGREVAIKILPNSLATDTLPLRRFEQEARAAAALNHPNILVVYDIGTYRTDGTAAVATLEECSYIVSELLEGETLRERLRAGPLPVRKVLDYARQIASGLAAAHDKGIVHRDLKPENIFITTDGRVKILDFGLAKLTQPDSIDGQTLSGFVESKVGTVLGTVGYMSPEQVRGRATDARSDLFSFGAILYEMLSGRRAFQGDSVPETMSAILKEDPPDLTATNRAVPPSLEYIVRHCLEKNPVERLQSARDAGFDLGLISGDSVAASTARVRTPPRRLYLAALGALAAALLAGAFFIGRKTAPKPNDASYHQLTFRRGLITSALFAPEGHTVLYAADWEGTGHQLYSARDDTRSSLPLGLQNTDVLGISPSGEVAVLQNPKRLQGWCYVGTLSMTSANGGAPRPVLEDVGAIAWAPDGNSFAVVRYVDKRYRLEYPIGKTIFTTNGWISSPRFSPKGDLIAFLHHPVFGDDRGEVAVVDKEGHARVVAKGFASTQGLAWMPSTGEIWFTASDTGTLTALRAVTRDGKSRIVTRSPGRLLLQDIAQDGRVLITEESARRVILVSVPGQKSERDVALLDWSLLRAISNDGKSILLTEEGEGGGPNYSVYLRNLIDLSAIRLGDGEGWALSPDGKFVLAASLTTPRTVSLLPTGAGEPRILNVGNINFDYGTFTPDGNSIVFSGVEQSKDRRVFAMDLKGGAPRPITPPGVAGQRNNLVSPDGKSVLIFDDDKWWLYPLSGTGQPQEVKGLDSKDDLAGWSSDVNVVYAGPQVEIPAKVYRVNIATGQRNFCCQFAPSDPTGMRGGVGPIIINPEKQLSAFGFSRRSSNLYLMDAPK
jgi:Tol biopolymer transport system component